MLYKSFQLLLILLLASSCATRKILEYDKIDEFEMNKEFEEMVKVEKPPEVIPEEKAGKAPPPKRSVKDTKKQIRKKTAPVKVKPKKVSKKPRIKKKEKSVEKPEQHLPKLEDSKGFIGRRPIIDPFKVGEEVELAVTYFNMAAGYMKLKVNPFVQVNGEKSYDLTIGVKSSKVFSYFYSVDDLSQTFLNFETLTPSTYTIKVKETKQLKDIRSFFDFKKNKAVYWEKKKAKGKPESSKKKEWDIEAYSQNVISAIFYLRTFDLAVGKELAFRVADAGKNIIFKGHVLRKEKLKTQAGEFNTVVVKPTLEIDGAFKQVGDIFIWLTDDDRKFPIKIEAKIKIGTLVLKLNSLKKGQ